jgi:hypothetical protein
MVLESVPTDTAIAGLLAVLAAAYAAYLKGQSTATAKVSSTVASPATAVVTSALPTSVIFNPAEHGGKGPNFWTWSQMKGMVLFKVSDVTKKNMLDGVKSEKDRADILKYIDEAEKTNEYAYTIDYDSGYYVMHAVCSPIGVNEYKYQVLVVESGMDKQ